MNSDIVEKLKHIITNELDVNIGADEVDAEVSLLEDGLGLDSIAIIEFITLIEEQFGFKFDEDDLDMDSFQNLTILSEFIATKLPSPQEAS